MTRSFRSLILLLAALLVLPLAIAAQPVEAGKKFKRVTKTFSNNSVFLISGFGGTDVGPAAVYPDTIAVKGFKRAKIKDVNLTLGFSHENPDDIDVLLVRPHNGRSLVLSDVGGSHDVSNVVLTLDDEAAGPLPNSDQLLSGTYQPTNAIGNDPGDPFPPPAPLLTETTALSVFDGIKPNGQWHLFIRDDLSGGTGIVDGGWSLEITAKVKKKKK